MDFISANNLTVVGMMFAGLYAVASNHKDKYEKLKPLIPTMLLSGILLTVSYSFGHMDGKSGEESYAGDSMMVLYEAFLVFFIVNALTE